MVVLYTIFQQDDGMLALNWALSKQEDIPLSQKIPLEKAPDFCLSHNYFLKQVEFYSRRKAVAMGTKFAPCLANIFMAERENQFVYPALN